MKARRVRRPPVLDALPAELAATSNPAACACEGCRPCETDPDGVLLRRRSLEWRKARIDWCADHGYSVFELLVAEQSARIHSSR